MRATFGLTASLAIVSTLAAVSCNESTLSPGATYPTTYAALPSPDRDALIAQFERENPNYCSTLDAYGFTEYSTDCSYRVAGSVTCANADQFIEQAKAEVLRNQQFTGVLHGEELEVWTHTCYETSWSPNMEIHFWNQVWEGLQVIDTQMSVIIDDQGTWSIAGHHYPEILVPQPVVSAERAEKSLVGTTLTGLNDYVVKEDSFVGDPVRVVYPLHAEGRIELRVTWSINVNQSWMVYVDSVTGEEVAVAPQFPD
jgi:hypothetical protein